jgi:hypothetical protein
MMDPVMVKHGQDIGEVTGFEDDGCWVLFLGEKESVLVPADELTVVQGNQG